MGAVVEGVEGVVEVDAVGGAVEETLEEVGLEEEALVVSMEEALGVAIAVHALDH
jgi:hypothetical protein